MSHLRFARHSVALVLALLGVFLLATATRAAGPQVVVLHATGVVDNVMAGYLEDGVSRAARDGASAVVIQLNTPGGSLDATQRITSALLTAKVPTIVWVAPSGGYAASAGTFITLSANLAFMAQGTNIGAASPVGSNGQDITGTEGEKVRNHAIANITAIAEARGRNVAWAVSTVKEAHSSPASEAVSQHAVDGIADSLDAVLAAADGRQVSVAGTTVTLALAGAATSDAAMNPLQGFLHLLSDPNIAFILFTVGAYGLIFEVMHPNFVTGILGALSLILAFIGFGSLPLNVAGLLLIGLAVVLFILEVQITSHGLLTVGGIVSFVLGASALYTQPGDPTAPLVGVAWPLIATMALTTAVLMTFVTMAAIRTRHLAGPSGTVGSPILLGAEGVAQAPIEPLGTVYVAGEAWSARSVDGRPIPRGTPVRLVGFDGLIALVEPIAGASGMPAGRPLPPQGT